MPSSMPESCHRGWEPTWTSTMPTQDFAAGISQYHTFHILEPLVYQNRSSTWLGEKNRQLNCTYYLGLCMSIPSAPTPAGIAPLCSQQEGGSGGRHHTEHQQQNQGPPRSSCSAPVSPWQQQDVLLYSIATPAQETSLVPADHRSTKCKSLC